MLLVVTLASLFVTSPTGLTLLIFTYKAMCSIAQGSRMHLSDLVVCVCAKKVLIERTNDLINVKYVAMDFCKINSAKGWRKFW